MNFKPYWQSLSAAQREVFAVSVGTTTGYCHQIAYGDKKVELGLADAMVAHGGGLLSHDDLPLTTKAKFQRHARSVAPATHKPVRAGAKARAA